jgi:hypothetical protein
MFVVTISLGLEPQICAFHHFSRWGKMFVGKADYQHKQGQVWNELNIVQ